LPTQQTPESILSGNFDKTLKTDLIGKEWKKTRTIGAIQFPAKPIENKPLAE
jgi:hypothetical protein